MGSDCTVSIADCTADCTGVVADCTADCTGVVADCTADCTGVVADCTAAVDPCPVDPNRTQADRPASDTPEAAAGSRT
jgi:hypothetical protein